MYHEQESISNARRLHSLSSQMRSLRAELEQIESILCTTSYNVQYLTYGLYSLSSLITGSNSDLEEIRNALSLNFSAINNELRTLNAAVAANQAELAEISADVSNIESILLDPSFGLEEIQSSINLTNSQLQDPFSGLVAIRNAIDDLM